MKVSFLQDENSWIHAPHQVEIESILPVRPYLVGRSKAPSLDTKNPNSEIWNIRGFGTSQILRITIKGADKIPQGQPGEGNMPWIFIDEIQIN